jgi:hypothetical protein
MFVKTFASCMDWAGKYLKDYDCYDEKYVQILGKVEFWSRECKKYPDFKSLSGDAKKTFIMSAIFLLK